MFGSLFAALTGQSATTETITRRVHQRRSADHCVSVISGKTYPVENWSQGGVLVYGDSRSFALNEQVNVTMKFRLRNEVIDVPHKARVVRKGHDKVAFEFTPATDAIRRKFQSVIDDFLTAEFVESQLT